MIDRRIKVRHVQCFVEIVRRKSLKEAADHLSLTQPAISKTLKELEGIVGSTLLRRSRAGVELTEEGAIFFRFAEASLSALQQALDGVERLAGRVLTIGALPSVSGRLIPRLLQDLREVAGDLRVRIQDGPHGFLVDGLRDGALDVVIGRLGVPETMRGLEFTQLYNEHIEFVVRPGHPLLHDPDLRRLGDWPVLFPPEGSAIRPLLDRYLIANGVGEVPDKIETVSGALGRIYTRETDAIWIISAGVVARELADGQLVRLPFDTSITKGPVGLMTRPNERTIPGEATLRIALDRSVKALGLS